MLKTKTKAHVQGEVDPLSTQLDAWTLVSQLGHIQFTSNFLVSISICINIENKAKIVVLQVSHKIREDAFSF